MGKDIKVFFVYAKANGHLPSTPLDSLKWQYSHDKFPFRFAFRRTASMPMTSLGMRREEGLMAYFSSHLTDLRVCRIGMANCIHLHTTVVGYAPLA
jgi:hypothetical protein